MVVQQPRARPGYDFIRSKHQDRAGDQCYMRAYLCEDSREITGRSAWGSLVFEVGYFLGHGATGMFPSLFFSRWLVLIISLDADCVQRCWAV